MIPLLLCQKSGGFTFGSHLPRQAEHFVRDTHEYGQTQHNQQQDGAHSHDRLAIGGGGAESSGIRVLVHSGRSHLPSGKSYLSMGLIGTAKTDRWHVWGCRPNTPAREREIFRD